MARRALRAVMAATCGLWLLSGCGLTVETTPAGSFNRQLAELRWSAETLVGMDYNFDASLRDARAIFLGDEKDMSLEPLVESFYLLGW